MLRYNKFEDIMMHISKTMGIVFAAEKVHLWMTDADTGIFYTFNVKKKKIKCFSNKGLISVVIKNGQLIHCKKFS